MNGEHAVMLALGMWWYANRKSRRSLAHNFTFPEIVGLARQGKLVMNTTGQGEIMQIAGSIQGSSQVRNTQQTSNGNGNGGGNARRVFVPNAPPPQQRAQSNPQSTQSRRSTMPDDNNQEQGSTTQVVQATIQAEDVGKVVRVALSDVQGETLAQPSQPDPMAKMLAEIEALKRQNQQLATDLQASKDLRRGVGLTIKISDKGALSVYGLQRFPTTLYAAQWKRLFDPDFQKAMLDMIETHTLVKDGGKLVEGSKDASGALIPHVTYQYK
jgi:hypothetical protein